MADSNNNQGFVNYKNLCRSLIEARRRMSPCTPRALFEVLKNAGCEPYVDEAGRAFMARRVGACIYNLNPQGTLSRQWIADKCRAAGVGYIRPDDYQALLIEALAIGIQSARMEMGVAV